MSLTIAARPGFAASSADPTRNPMQCLLMSDDYSPSTVSLQDAYCAGMPSKTLQLAFGTVLREHRQKAGFSQEGLADAAGCDRTFIGMLERGQRQPTLDTLFRIADALGVTPAALVTRTSSELKK